MAKLLKIVMALEAAVSTVAIVLPSSAHADANINGPQAAGAPVTMIAG